MADPMESRVKVIFDLDNSIKAASNFQLVIDNGN